MDVDQSLGYSRRGRKCHVLFRPDSCLGGRMVWDYNAVPGGSRPGEMTFEPTISRYRWRKIQGAQNTGDAKYRGRKMVRWIVALGLVAMSAYATQPAQQTAAEETTDPAAIQIMVVGAFHLGNPGQDVANAEIENMLTDRRQSEIAAAAEAIAAFKPTVVAVERITAAPDYIDPNFAAFTPAMLGESADERCQIGYRVAKLAGVTRVYGIDEQPGEGEPDYFPFGELAAHAEATGQSGVLNAQIADIQARSARFSAMQKEKTFSELLIVANQDASSDDEFYYRTFAFDRGETQPGAELQAYWFMRNAKIFSKLAQVTKPGDRVVVVYGAGHKAWLEHFADHTPGFARVDPVTYLEKAAP